MPFVQIDLPAATSPDAARRIADAVHDAMVETIDIPVDDRFQVIAMRDPALRIFDRGYLGVTRSDACVFVRIALNRDAAPTRSARSTARSPPTWRGGRIRIRATSW